MAKTIKEMAMDAYLQGLYTNSHDWKEGYEAGANAVLEEIEDILYRRYSDDGDPHQRWIDMNKVFKELKG